MSATSRRTLTRRLGLALTATVALWSGVSLFAQIPGRNINMVAGTDWPGGDPFLQRQNEPSMTASTRNPLHLVAGSNDYRTVDLPGLPDGAETGDAWVSVYKSFDGGQRWSSTLMPGFPQDTSAAGMASPIKGYQAAADPVVRAGTHGLIYYNGLVFDRGDNGKSAIFLTRFIDRNNKENGDPIAFLGTSLVVASNGTTFLDKPWMAVDIPRGDGAMCVVGGTPTGAKVKRNGHRRRGKSKGKDRDDDDGPWLDPGLQYVPAGAVYVAYTAITGDGPTLQSQIFVKRSMDCGVTWTAPMRVTATTDMINQGATLAISPATGDLFVAWRRFSTPTVSDVDAVMMARLRINGGSFDAPGKARGLRRTGPDSEAVEKIFEHRKRRATPVVAASVSQIDQPTSPYRFRSNAYPSMTIDGAGRAYVAWSERGYAAARPDPTDGDARILVASTLDGRTFSAPVVVDDQAQLGHQLMPSLAFAGGKLMLLFYDLRETRAQMFQRFVDDSQSTNFKRQTIDIRAAMGTPGATPTFAPSVRVSDYLMGYRSSTATLEQLQVNPPNLPMFKQGTVPFIGDYIDIAPAPAFVPTATGDWVYNTAPSAQMPVFHATWTDNRDVRAPRDGNWANYTPPTINGQLPVQSLFDPTKTVAFCKAGNAGSRNQNIYTARIGGGLLVGAPGNTKPLSTTVQRGFVVFAQNQTTVTKTFRMSVLAQPVGGRASFEQFPLPPYTPASPLPLTFVDVRVPARSTATRTVYVTSTDPKATLSVDVTEVAAVAGPVVSGGLAGRVVLNPDIENPDIENPDIENPDIVNPNIANAEVYNPDIENPDIENPDIENPDIENPDIENPDIENINVANPDIENLGVANPDIENPDIENPDIENPDIENPDIENGAVADVTWSVSNIGNTTSGFNVNLFLANANVPAGLKTQLIVYKVYKTPVLDPNGCDLRTETRNQVLFNVPNPNLITPGEGLPSQNDPSDTNATLWLAPGEVGRVTLRVFDDDTSNNLIYTNLDGSTASIDPAFNPATVVTAAISAQGVDVLDPPGATKPPAVTTTGTNLFFLQQPSNVAPATLIAPAVKARIWDNTGAPLPGVVVTIALLNPPSGVLLSGTTTAVADANGIATFPALSVNVPATGLQLRATATSPGVVAAGTSAPFDVVNPTIPASVFISNYAAIFDGTPKPVTVTTVPTGLATAITYSGNPLARTAIGAYNVVATVTSPGYVGVGSAVQTIASTISAGGPGGGAYGPLSCGPGVYANGLRAAVDGGVNTGFGFIGYALTSGQLLCSDSNHPAKFGGGTTPNADLVCPAGQVMVGFAGGTTSPFGPGAVVGGVAPRCQLPAGGPITQAGSALPSAFGVPFAIDCPAGTAVTGVVGGQGAVVDAIALVCSPVSVPVFSSRWHADGSATDAVGGNNGTLQGGATYAAGRIGQAFSFTNVLTGGGQYVQVPATPTLEATTAVTMAAWIRPTAVFPTNDAIIVNKEGEYEMARFPDGSIRFAFAGVAGYNWVDGTGPNAAPLNTWTHVAVTYDQGTVVTYINGVAVTTTTGQPSPIDDFYPAEDELWFGGRQTFAANPEWFDGQIDEVLVQTSALTAADVLALYQAAPTITSASPAAPVAAGFGQMLTVNGINLSGPGSNAGPFPRQVEQQVVVSQGGNDFPAHVTFFGSSTKWIFRLPTSGLVPGPATVRITNPAVTSSSNAFPFTISSTPAAPVITSVMNSCGGAAITSISTGSPFGIAADGIDTSGAVIVWTNTATGQVITQSFLAATGLGSGSACVYPTSPTAAIGTNIGAPGLSPGTWRVQLTTSVNFVTSALSNGVILTVP